MDAFNKQDDNPSSRGSTLSIRQIFRANINPPGKTSRRVHRFIHPSIDDSFFLSFSTFVYRVTGCSEAAAAAAASLNRSRSRVYNFEGMNRLPDTCYLWDDGSRLIALDMRTQRSVPPPPPRQDEHTDKRDAKSMTPRRW